MIRFKEVLVDRSVDEYPLTGRILDSLRHLSVRRIPACEAQERLKGSISEAAALPDAKRILMITKNPGSFFKYMGDDPGINDCQRSDSVRLDIMQGCPVDCRYCFCQRYLTGHHVVTFSNVEDAAGEYRQWTHRLVTGDIADSLALGQVSIIMHKYIASIFPDAVFELRSKFRLPENWEELDPARFRLDWSLSPDEQWRVNEPGTDRPAERIAAASKAALAGFSVGIRLDPLQPDRINPDAYESLIVELQRAMAPAVPRGFIVGSYKMSTDLIETIRTRFPENPLPGYEWTRCSDGKLRPFRAARIASYRIILGILRRHFAGVPIFLSMESPFVLNLLQL